MSAKRGENAFVIRLARVCNQSHSMFVFVRNDIRKSMMRWKFGAFYIYSTTVYPDNGDYPWLL